MCGGDEACLHGLELLLLVMVVCAGAGMCRWLQLQLGLLWMPVSSCSHCAC